MDIAANIVIGTCLRKHRIALSLTQRELACRMNRHQSYIAKVENGERRLAVVDLYTYSMALECDFNLIVDEIRVGLTESGCIPTELDEDFF